MDIFYWLDWFGTWLVILAPLLILIGLLVRFIGCIFSPRLRRRVKEHPILHIVLLIVAFILIVVTDQSMELGFMLTIFFIVMGVLVALIGFILHKQGKQYRILHASMVIIILVAGCYLGSSVMIKYCAADLAFHHMPSSFSGSAAKTKFLIMMGKRSILAIKYQLSRSDVGLNEKVHLAWILSSIGDHSCFHVFIDGLNSDDRKVQAIALARMEDFPEQFVKYFPEILAVRGERKDESYWIFIGVGVYRGHLDNENRNRTIEIIDQHRADKLPLTEEEQHEILNMLKYNTEEGQREVLNMFKHK